MNFDLLLLAAAAVALVLAALPAALFRQNLAAYRTPSLPPPAAEPPRVSILIPARDEERAIEAAVESALASREVVLEVLVLDDHSVDATAEIVRRIAARDGRVRCIEGPPLPDGWCGKQHACWVLAGSASYDRLCFQDADVRLEPDGLARLVHFLDRSGSDLVSGIPFQETGTFGERLVIPLIHFVLLGFLPLNRMRSSVEPAYGAGCGQLFLATRQGYQTSGGHAAIRATLHDGLKLPRAFRAAGLKTDLCDATSLACCRMYRSAGELWQGLEKNAVEGLASPALIVPSTILLLLGQVAPLVLLGMAIARRDPLTACVALGATAFSYAPRLAGVARFRQSPLGAWFHPLGVLFLLAIQWSAWGRLMLGRPRHWKGRVHAGLPGPG